MTTRSCCLASLIVILIAAVVRPDEHTSPPDPNNVACGPRCVRRVLHEHGIDVPLLDLLRDMPVTATRGVSLSAVADALANRGVYAKTAYLHDIRSLKWPHPVVVHCSDKDVDGHFFVLLPNSTENALTVWDGLAGDDLDNAKRLLRNTTGYVVLTSDQPIADLPMTRSSWVDIVMVTGIIGSIAFVYYSFTRRKRKLL